MQKHITRIYNAGLMSVVTNPARLEATLPMTLGLIRPIGEDYQFGETPRFTDLVAMAQAAREFGFEPIWLGLITSCFRTRTMAVYVASGKP